jgi:hypothetical protein
LMLTRLGPWTILLEKYLGRLVTMGTYLLLSVPLLGFCYCFGGLEQSELWIGLLALAVTIAQVAAIGMCCSAYCRTTVSAFLLTYTLAFLVLLGPNVLFQITRFELLSGLADLYTSVVVLLARAYGPFLGTPLVALGLLVAEDLPWLADADFNLESLESAGLFFAPTYSISGFAFGRPVWQSLAMFGPALFSTLVFLLLARFWLIRRAFATPSRLIMRLFAGLDKFFYQANQNRYTKGIVLVNDFQTLPDGEPIAWRETSKKALGTVRYLVRVLLVMQFPTLLICLSAAMYGSSNSAAGSTHNVSIMLVNFICWVAAVLLISVKSATLVSGELLPDEIVAANRC